MSEVIEQEHPSLKGLTGLKRHHAMIALKKEQERGLKSESNSLKKEEEEKEDVNDVGIDPTKTYVFETIVKSASPRHQMLSSSCKVFDPNANRIREIRYIPIADTIFVDEMGDRYKDYPDAVLSFHRDQLCVSGTDKRLVEFLLASDEYDGNKNRLSKKPATYTLVNKHDLELTKENLFEAKLKAMNAINSADEDELIPIARVIFSILETDILVVKNKLREIAEKRPNEILNNIDSPKVKREYVIQSALDQGIIEVNSDKRALVWSETKTFIKELIAFKDAKALLSELGNYSFTTEGSRFYDIIKQKIKS